MSQEAKTRAVAGLAAVISGVMLIGTTGLTLIVGWALWAAGLGVLLAAIPSSGEQRPPFRRRELSHLGQAPNAPVQS